MSELIEIILNGKPRQISEGMTLTGLVESLSLNPTSIVIEHNEEVADKSTLHSVVLQSNDKVEILQFVGGG